MPWTSRLFRAHRRVAGATGVVALFSLVAPALAAAPSGTYTGMSSGRTVALGGRSFTTDKGHVGFYVRSGDVVKFNLTGQRFFCGGQRPEIAIRAAKINLDSAGRGKATVTLDPVLGKFVIAIRVTRAGQASGTVTPKGPCAPQTDTDGTVYGRPTFSAKRR